MDKQLIRISQAVSSYYQQPEAEPEPRHFNDWINSMRGLKQNVFRRKGFNACKDLPSFRRFMAGLKDERLEEHMMRHLPPEDYQCWKQQQSV